MKTNVLQQENINILMGEKADNHAIDFAKWLTDFENIKEILQDQTWEEILNQYYKYKQK